MGSAFPLVPVSPSPSPTPTHDDDDKDCCCFSCIHQMYGVIARMQYKPSPARLDLHEYDRIYTCTACAGHPCQFRIVIPQVELRVLEIRSVCDVFCHACKFRFFLACVFKDLNVVDAIPQARALFVKLCVPLGFANIAALKRGDKPPNKQPSS